MSSLFNKIDRLPDIGPGFSTPRRKYNERIQFQRSCGDEVMMMLRKSYRIVRYDGINPKVQEPRVMVWVTFGEETANSTT